MAKFGWCLSGQHHLCARIMNVVNSSNPYCTCDCHEEDDDGDE